MNKQTIDLADRVVAKHQLESIEGVMRLIPKYMCHVLQECDVFRTYPQSLVKLTFPESEWSYYIERYGQVRDEVIPNIGVDGYLEAMLAYTSNGRLPCFCSETSDVAGILANRVLGKEVYALRNIFVNYLVLPQRWHCINCVEWNGRIRYFDSSAYAQVLNPQSRKVVAPDELEGFDASDIKESLIKSKRWLQKDPYARTVNLQDGKVIDSFYPSPIDGKPVDEYLRTFG
jgi:hypothetical protein